MSWYTTGTVSLTNGSKTVIGTSTKWANPLIGVCAGQMLILKTANTIEICEIASVQSDTQLTLANQYSGASKTGISYKIPTAPKVSIEALALRISEMLNYYQQQMNGWQSILTGEREVTLTAPDGKIVTIKSQKAITEAIQKIDVNGIGCRNVLSDVDSFQLNGFGFVDKKTKGNKPFEWAEIIQSGNGKFESTQIALDLLSNRVKVRSGRANKWNEWYEAITTANSTVDSNGFLKKASPILRLYGTENIEKVDGFKNAGVGLVNYDALGVTAKRINAGHYEIHGSLGFAKEGWYIQLPEDANGNKKFFAEYSTDENNVITVKTYSRKFDFERCEVVAGEPVDITDGRWIDVRLEMPVVEIDEQEDLIPSVLNPVIVDEVSE